MREVIKSGEDIEAHVVKLILEIYMSSQPLIYGESAAMIESVLLTYHDMWAFIHDKQILFRDSLSQVYDEQECGGARFGERYSWEHPNANERQKADYAIEQWKSVSRRIGLLQEKEFNKNPSFPESDPSAQPEPGE